MRNLMAYCSERRTNDESPSTLVMQTLPDPMIDEQTAEFLGRWGIGRLAGGDRVAALNTLVGMAGVIGGAAGPDAGIQDEDGSHYPVGFDWWVTGEVTASVHRDQLIRPLETLQNNLVHGASDLREIEALQAEINQGRAPAHREQSRSIRQLGKTLENPSLFGDFSAAGQMLDWLMEPVPELRARPIVYFEGSDTAGLHKRLDQAHLGQPLVSFSPRNPAHFHQTRAAQEAVSDGRQLASGLTLRGHALTMLDTGLFTQLVEEESFTGRSDVLVLSDQHSENLSTLLRTEVEPGFALLPAFEKALKFVLQSRLEGDGESLVIKIKGWSTILNQLRGRLLKAGLPSESFGLAMKLYGTLAYGLAMIRQLANAASLGASPSLQSLTVFLLRRSDYVVQRIRWGAECERIMRIATKIASQLEKFGPHTARDLTRRHNHLRIDECRQALSILVEGGWVHADGDLQSPATRFALPG